MTAFSVRGAARRGEVIVTVDGDRLAVADQSTSEVVWQRSGPGIRLELTGDELDIDGAMTVRVHPDQTSRAAQLVTRYRNAVPPPSPVGASSSSELTPPRPPGQPAASPPAARVQPASPAPAAAPVGARPTGSVPAYVNDLCDRLHRAANVVQVIAVVIGLLGIIAGIVIAADTNEVGDHLYAAEGIALAFASFIQAAVLYFFGVWGLAWAARNRVAR